MARRPGFIDEGGGREVPAEATTEADVSVAAAKIFATPMLLDLPGTGSASADRIDAGWAPATFALTDARASSLSWLAGGLALTGSGWIGLAAIAFLRDQFIRSSGLGWATLGVFIVGLGLILWGVSLEVRSYGALRRVDSLRRALADAGIGAAAAKRLGRAWIDAVTERLPGSAAALGALDTADGLDDVTAVLRARVDAPLDRIARQAALAAATQAGALVAVLPSPALDGVFTGLRGMALVRQIAQVYGLRPGLLVTLSLLRRVALMAASVSAAELLATSAADAVLHDVPVVKHLVRAATGTGVAASRLYRLGLIAARACSPLAGD